MRRPKMLLSFMMTCFPDKRRASVVAFPDMTATLVLKVVDPGTERLHAPFSDISQWIDARKPYLLKSPPAPQAAAPRSPPETRMSADRQTSKRFE